MASAMITPEQLAELAGRIVQLETTLNDERSAVATAASVVGGEGSSEQEQDWESTLEPTVRTEERLERSLKKLRMVGQHGVDTATYSH